MPLLLNEYNMPWAGSVFDGPENKAGANHNRPTFLFPSEWTWPQLVLNWLGISSVASVPGNFREPLAIFDVGRRRFAPKITYIFGTREYQEIEIPPPPPAPPAPPGGPLAYVIGLGKRGVYREPQNIQYAKFARSVH